ncbi:hypothetical protein [Glutamicibacter endophyticus]|uniref:hypothetical protein n=1 Tax=Glutamicibacter endophyticus TaxID=1522174 RepID=UPI003AF089E7
MKPPPAYWSRQTQEFVDRRGKHWWLTMWGWSQTSLEQAQRHARTRLQELIARGGPTGAERDWYYPAAPLREPCLESLGDGPEPLAVITRNRYGATVLNTDAVLIADVDLPNAPKPGWFSRLFGRGTATAEDPADNIRERIATFAAAHPTLGVRSYRTSAGFRVFITGSSAAPDSAEAEHLLRELGSDELYTKLCRSQHSYRARLSPKPWRIGLSAPTVIWPAPDSEAQRRLELWVESYRRGASGFSVTTREARFGPAPSLDEAKILRWHDEQTGADSNRPLA